MEMQHSALRGTLELEMDIGKVGRNFAVTLQCCPALALPLRNLASANANTMLREVLPEMGHCAFPRQFRCSLVVPWRGVVVEAVLRSRVDMHLVWHAGGL